MLRGCKATKSMAITSNDGKTLVFKMLAGAKHIQPGQSINLSPHATKLAPQERMIKFDLPLDLSGFPTELCYFIALLPIFLGYFIELLEISYLAGDICKNPT
jgi:hypothetical protein